MRNSEGSLPSMSVLHDLPTPNFTMLILYREFMAKIKISCYSNLIFPFWLVDPQLERNSGGNKPCSAGNESPLVELSGYNLKRQEFDPEYDNDAEQLLAEMEFKETDTDDERELKLRVLHIYSKR